MNEKVYKAMRNTGACNIVVGVLMIVVGLTAGIMSIVSGSVLLKKKGEILF